MVRKPGATPASAAPAHLPCPRPASMEITPAEFDAYMNEVPRLGAASVAVVLDRWFAALGRALARARKAARPRLPLRAGKRAPAPAA